MSEYMSEREIAEMGGYRDDDDDDSHQSNVVLGTGTTADSGMATDAHTGGQSKLFEDADVSLKPEDRVRPIEKFDDQEEVTNKRASRCGWCQPWSRDWWRQYGPRFHFTIAFRSLQPLLKPDAAILCVIG